MNLYNEFSSSLQNRIQKMPYQQTMLTKIHNEAQQVSQGISQMFQQEMLQEEQKRETPQAF